MNTGVAGIPAGIPGSKERLPFSLHHSNNAYKQFRRNA